MLTLKQQIIKPARSMRPMLFCYQGRAKYLKKMYRIAKQTTSTKMYLYKLQLHFLENIYIQYTNKCRVFDQPQIL